MGDSDRDYRRDFYRALNVHQGAQMEEFERYYVPIYARPDAGRAGSGRGDRDGDRLHRW